MATKNPNILLITCDALRGDAVGCCGDGKGASLTPNLDRLAQKGIAFKKAYSQGYATGISMPSLFTGKNPRRLTQTKITNPFGITRAKKSETRCFLIGEETTVTEILAKHGYRTAGIHSNPLLTSFFGFNKGFEFFYEDLFLKDANLPGAVKRWTYRLPRLFRSSPHLNAAAMNRKALAWIEDAKEPYFLWLHYMDPHGPYLPKHGFSYLNKVRSEILYHKAARNSDSVTEEECRTLIDWYREEVRYLDYHLGKLFERLEASGQMDNTLVVLTADHGEEFREHGHFSHHSTLYDELLHVPLIFKLPHSRHAGRTTARAVALTQVVPSILEIAGVPTESTFDGKSLRPFIETGSEQSFHDFIISEARTVDKWKACIRNEEWKLIVDLSKSKRELYHLKTDPREQRNVVEEQASLAPALEEELKQRLSLMDAAEDRSEVVADNVDEEVIDRLKDLGYL